MGGPGVGDEAPTFTLPGTGGHTYSLAAYRGRAVLLVFYPGDETPVCTQQLRSYSDDISQFQHLGAKVLAISPQSVASHERFAAKCGVTFPLLSDPDRAVGRAYGVVGPVGFYRRSVFVVNAAGRVTYAHRALAGLTYRPTTELVRAVKAATPGEAARGPV